MLGSNRFGSEADLPARERTPQIKAVVHSHVFFGFIVVIFMAAFTCAAQPLMSCCDCDDFAAVISCIAFVLLSPSGICITVESALAMSSFVQPEAFDLAASTGEAATTVVANATTNNFEIMSVTPKGVIAALKKLTDQRESSKSHRSSLGCTCLQSVVSRCQAVNLPAGIIGT